jgi:hypothetical protein
MATAQIILAPDFISVKGKVKVKVRTKLHRTELKFDVIFAKYDIVGICSRRNCGLDWIGNLYNHF